jgi:hypothetical protein
MVKPTEKRLSQIREAAAETIALHRQARGQQIDRLVAQAKKVGGVTDRLYWSMVFDFEVAPWTTNRAMLESIGIDTAAHNKSPKQLGEIVWGLAEWGVFLRGTDHLSDEALCHRLQQAIGEQVRCVVGPDCHEWLDLSGGEEGLGTVIERDQMLPRPSPAPGVQAVAAVGCN